MCVCIHLYNLFSPFIVGQSLSIRTGSKVILSRKDHARVLQYTQSFPEKINNGNRLRLTEDRNPDKCGKMDG